MTSFTLIPWNDGSTPSEITIGDFKLNCFYIASGCRKETSCPTFQQATLKLAEWIEMYGLDHLSFSLWSIDEEGQPAKWTDLSSNEIFYLSVYNYLLKSRTPFESKGVVKFIDDKIIPAVMIDNYEEVQGIVFFFFRVLFYGCSGCAVPRRIIRS